MDDLEVVAAVPSQGSRAYRAFYVNHHDGMWMLSAVEESANMTTHRKSNAVKFLEKRAGPLTLGGLLAAIRKGDGISQAEFARTLNLSRSHLCDLEKGRKAASPARAAQMAKQLGYSQQQFVRLALQALVEEAGLRLKVTVR